LSEIVQLRRSFDDTGGSTISARARARAVLSSARCAAASSCALAARYLMREAIGLMREAIGLMREAIGRHQKPSFDSTL
jgi:hypothetical protein